MNGLMANEGEQIKGGIKCSYGTNKMLINCCYSMMVPLTPCQCTDLEPFEIHAKFVANYCLFGLIYSVSKLFVCWSNTNRKIVNAYFFTTNIHEGVYLLVV